MNVQEHANDPATQDRPSYLSASAMACICAAVPCLFVMAEAVVPRFSLDDKAPWHAAHFDA
jgi:hypothetical protein